MSSRTVKKKSGGIPFVKDLNHLTNRAFFKIFQAFLKKSDDSPILNEELNLFRKRISIFNSGVFFVESFLICSKKERKPDIYSNTRGLAFNALESDFQEIIKDEFLK